jgi:hypothetical protein
MGNIPGKDNKAMGLPKGALRPKGDHPGVRRVKKGTKGTDHEEPAPPGATGMNTEVVIDEKMLYEAALTHASYRQLGLIFGVGEMTIRNNYDHIIQKARAERQKELLTAQFDTAITDRNPTMMIWLGKQYLGQTDVSRQEHTGKDGEAIKQETTQRVVAYIPENGRDSKE